MEDPVFCVYWSSRTNSRWPWSIHVCDREW